MRASDIESDKVELRRCAHSVEEPSIKVAARAERPRRRSELAAGVLRGGGAEGGGDGEEGESAIISVREMVAFKDQRQKTGGDESRRLHGAPQGGSSSSSASVQEFVKLGNSASDVEGPKVLKLRYWKYDLDE